MAVTTEKTPLAPNVLEDPKKEEQNVSNESNHLHPTAGPGTKGQGVSFHKGPFGLPLPIPNVGGFGLEPKLPKIPGIFGR